MKAAIFLTVLALASADLTSLFKLTVEPMLQKFVDAKVKAMLDSAGKLFTHGEDKETFVMNFLKGRLEQEVDTILKQAEQNFEKEISGYNGLSVEHLKEVASKIMKDVPGRLEGVLKKAVAAVEKYKTSPLKRRQVMAPVATNSSNMAVSVAPAGTSMTPAVTASPATARPCNKTLASLQEAFAFTKTKEFTELTENQQLLTYEVLAATEGCKLVEFIRPDTVLRLFRLFNDMPLKYVSLFMMYLSENLAAEGVMAQ